MSSHNATTQTQALSSLGKETSGFRTALRYTGIPTAWLSKRPKLPSRNWLIFLSVTSTLTGYYIYDRRECKRIKQHYIDLVKDQADETVDALVWPRKVTVYGSKWPGDEDYDQTIKHFRKYVKPILVAAAVDFEMISGRRHGDIAERVAEDIRRRRRLELGIDATPDFAKILPTYKTPEEVAKHQLTGGLVVIGRPTLKEFMFGLKKGWTDGLEAVDQEELLARELETDGQFDEPEETSHETQLLPDYGPQSSNIQKSPILMPNQISSSSFQSPAFQPPLVKNPPPVPDVLNTCPPTIPPIPPLLLVSFTNHIGFSQIPTMIWGWFNRRHQVRAGAEAGYALVMNHTRPVIPPTEEPKPLFDDIATPPSSFNQGDLDFDMDAEGWYRKSVSKIPSEIEKARKKYYEELPTKLATARALHRGTREPTKEEANNPPPTEVELRAERLKKELRWRRDAAGWEMIKPSQRVVWDDRFRDVIHIFSVGDKNESDIPL